MTIKLMLGEYRNVLCYETRTKVWLMTESLDNAIESRLTDSQFFKHDAVPRCSQVVNFGAYNTSG